jgi:hypothetical protein
MHAEPVSKRTVVPELTRIGSTPPEVGGTRLSKVPAIGLFTLPTVVMTELTGPLLITSHAQAVGLDAYPGGTMISM